jgi:PAS domain S-box-containing protein
VEGLLGYTQEEWLSDPVLWYSRLHPEDREMWNVEFMRGCASGGPFRAECRFMARDGHAVWVHGEARIIRDERGRPMYLQGVAFDITENKVAEEKVKASLHEKEVLLKEIHHRVKNNLQVTSSLLKLQSAKVQDAAALALLQESRDRIRSMALVHEKLYQSDDLSHVEFSWYVRSLVGSLSRSYGPRNARVAVVVDVQDVFLSIDAAVPCGLIINELITNALKYGFPDDGGGEVRLHMRPVGESYVLTVEDDGVGLPADFDYRNTPSLGMQLVVTLADQLEGHVDAVSNGGTKVTLTFPRK